MTSLRNTRDYRAEDRERFVREGLWNDDTLTTWLEYWSARTPDQIAIRAPQGDISYRELDGQVGRLAGELLDLGIRRGQAVAIQLPNLPEFLVIYLAVARIGAVLLTMHMPYRSEELAPLLRHGRARAIVCGPANARFDAPAVMCALRERLPHAEHILVAGPAPAPTGCLSLNECIDRGRPRPVTDPPVVSDPVLLCFTSGTSAAPKAVLRTYETACANARIYSPTIGLDSHDVVMIAPPFTHVFGLCCVHNTLCHGATIALLPLFTPEAYAETIARCRPSVLFTAPAHVAATLKAGLLDDVDLSSLREVVIAGSVCPPEVAAALERRMPSGRAGQLFGMTETILIMQTPTDAPADVRHGSTGRVTQGIEARIASPTDGSVLGLDEEGELQVRGYSIMSGYLANDEANRAAFTEDNWFRTGDLATIDADGNVRITGRVKDIINRGGVKINPTDVENAVVTHPDVIHAAIVPMPDDVLGEKACLFVTVVPNARMDLETMLAHLESQGVARMRWPERLEVIDEMPMTPTRKIVKGELKARLVDPN